MIEARSRFGVWRKEHHDPQLDFGHVCLATLRISHLRLREEKEASKRRNDAARVRSVA